MPVMMDRRWIVRKGSQTTVDNCANGINPDDKFIEIQEQ